MILKNKIISISLSILLVSALAFGSAPVVQTANYSPNTNQLVLAFDQDVKVDNVLLGLISFDDDQGGPNADINLLGGSVHNPGGLTLSDEITINLLYDDIIDSYTGEFFGNTTYLFELWGTDVSQVKSLEAMASTNLAVSTGA